MVAGAFIIGTWGERTAVRKRYFGLQCLDVDGANISKYGVACIWMAADFLRKPGDPENNLRESRGIRV